MPIVTVHEAKTHLSRLIRRALAGEEIIIARRDQPLVRLTVIEAEPADRRLGGLAGLVMSMDDSFDEELPDFADYSPRTPRVAEDPRP